MANKRMFSKEIVNSDAFLDMPMSTQLLYFHLNMVADDDGFVSAPKRIMRMMSASEDDLKLLIAKSFILSSELWNGVIVVKHWRINNFMQKDRYKPTVYQDEKKMIELKNNGAYTWKKAEETILDCHVNKVLTQNSKDKNSIDKNSIEKDSEEDTTIEHEVIFVGNVPTLEEVKLYCDEHKYTFDVNEFYEYYDEVNWTMPDSRHSFNWKKKCDLWQRNEKTKKVAVPEFMRDQAEGIFERLSKPVSKETLEKIKEIQEKMKVGE